MHKRAEFCIMPRIKATGFSKETAGSVSVLVFLMIRSVQVRISSFHQESVRGMKKLFRALGLHERGIWRDFLFIVIGAAVMGFGIGVFLVDAKVVPGGVSGLSMTLHYLSGGKIPVGVANFRSSAASRCMPPPRSSIY